jgi:hypothetical protein
VTTYLEGHCLVLTIALAPLYVLSLRTYAPVALSIWLILVRLRLYRKNTVVVFFIGTIRRSL